METTQETTPRTDAGFDTIFESDLASSATPADTSSKRRGAKAEPSFATGELVQVPLSEIDTEDTSCCFRKALRVASLERSILADGLHTPLVLRRLASGRYQLVSGFRRMAAVTELRWNTVPAFVRDDLHTDEAEFAAAVLENLYRKTYNDIDRALVIRAYQDRAYTWRDIAELMGVSARQLRRLNSLLELPPEAQEAIGDPDQHFGATHAIALKGCRRGTSRSTGRGGLPRAIRTR